jgi:Ca2+-dependent lipid-binding protein
MSMMEITGIEVHGLPDADKISISDPYVRFKLLLPDGSAFATGQTGVKQNARNCKWDDTVKLALPPDFSEGTLSVRVWDDDKKSDDDFIGRLDVPVELGTKTIDRYTVDGHENLCMRAGLPYPRPPPCVPCCC